MERTLRVVHYVFNPDHYIGIIIANTTLLYKYTAHRTIILPLWKSANYWPIVSPTGEGFISEVKGCIDLPTNKEYYTLGKGNISVSGLIYFLGCWL